MDARSWVDDEVSSTVSRFSTDLSLDGVSLELLVGRQHEDWWGVLPPHIDTRVCDRPGAEDEAKYCFMMYKNYFTDLGVRFPFTDFEFGVLEHLSVAPSQLHPNAWGFVRAFQLVCSYLDLVCTVPLFFYCFQISSSGKKKAWVSLRAGARVGTLFTAYSGSYKHFKELFFWVRPSEVNNPNPFFLDSERRLRFDLYWTDLHYQTPAGGYSSSYDELSEEEDEVVKLLVEIALNMGKWPCKGVIDFGGEGGCHA